MPRLVSRFPRVLAPDYKGPSIEINNKIINNAANHFKQNQLLGHRVTDTSTYQPSTRYKRVKVWQKTDHADQCLG